MVTILAQDRTGKCVGFVHPPPSPLPRRPGDHDDARKTAAGQVRESLGEGETQRPVASGWLARERTPTARRDHPIHISNSRLMKEPKLRRPCSRKARGAPGISIPSLTRGELPHNVRGAERRKARVTFNALRRTPNNAGRSPRGAPLRRFP